jgi:haloacetate dehalogenase
MLLDFPATRITTRETTIFIRSAGSGPPLLLLHGFPQTHAMWHRIAPVLMREFTVVCADLRGYGESGCPVSTPDHAPYSKRAMARDMIEVMQQLGFHRFSVAGHDRGARVAYRMALDHPHHVERLAVLDILPVEAVWERANAATMLGYWPWSVLAQAEPLSENILTASADAIVDAALSGWGSAAKAFPPEARAAYIAPLRDPAHAHAICEEYRAAAGIDREHDRGDRARGHRIACPLLALWSAQGPLNIWYEDEGGPLAVWGAWVSDMQGRAVPGGHFFPEEFPNETAIALRDFFRAQPAFSASLPPAMSA